MALGRLRAVFGVDVHKVNEVTDRSNAMYSGFSGDPGTYANPPIALSDFKLLITNVVTAQQSVKTRTLGAREKRDVELGLLLTGMEVERAFVQALADANPAKAAALITGTGLVVAGTAGRNKPLLGLRNGKQSGTVICDANVGQLVGPDAKYPTGRRYFNWEYTVDGGKTFVNALSTPRSRTTITGLTPLTTVGVRVSVTDSEGPGPWSQIVTILVL
jgi:hypothetical protein